ncbi:hypothetical protein REPUB_Repub02eG0206700 [Reevesia pubescens]
MTRKKVKLAWIVNDSARKASLKKRRLGLLKKVSELTTLCGTKACLIIYSPDENEPMVWPSHVEVRKQLGEFHRMPELEQMKKMTNQETYLRERAAKSHEQLSKQQRRNKEVEMGHLMHQINQGNGLDELNINEMRGLIWLVEEKMKEIRKHMEFFQQVPSAPAGPADGDLAVPPQDPEDNLTARIGGIAGAGLGGDHPGRTLTESFLWDQCFIDMMNINDQFKSAASSSTTCDMPYYPFAGTIVDDLRLVLPRHSFSGSSSVASEMGLPPFGSYFRGPTSDMEQPPLGTRPLPQGGASDMGMPHGSIGGSNFGPFGSDMGMGLHPFGTGSEFEGLPFGFFGGGGSSSGAGSSDMGLPFDGKTWPNNFSPSI